MRLNTTYWGSEYGAFWYSDITGNKLTNYVSENSFFTSTFKTETYNGVTYSNGQLSEYAKKNPAQYNAPIDNSICYAAIPASSPISTISYLNRTVSVAGGVEAYHGDTPLFLSCCFYGFEENVSSSMKSGGNGNSFLSNRWASWSTADINDVDHTAYPFSGGRLIMPIVKWNYNDVVLLLRVAVGDSLTNVESRVYDLADWEENYKTQYPYVYAVFGVPYLGKSGNRFNINNNIGVAYSGWGTSTTRSNYLRCSKNVPLTAPPNYHNNDVNDFSGPDSPTVLNYSSNVLVGSRLNDYGFSVGIGNASITPNATLDTFANTGSTNGNSGLYIYAGDNRVIESFPMGTPGNVSRVVTKIKDDVDLRKLMSWYGLQFVDHVDKVGAAIGSADLCIPIIGADGYTTGDYKTGDEAAELPNADWGENFREENGWDGRPNEPFNMETELYPQNSAAASPFTYQYVFNSTKLLNLKNYLYTTIASTTDETQLFEQFLTNNPIDCIASLTVFPFNVENYIDGVPGEHVILGNVDTGITATGIYRGMVIVLDGGTVFYRDYFGDFRSYEPYSDAELHIPYHGNIHITPSEYVGHTIGVKYLVDICSGASIALVFRDGLVIDSIAGQIGGTLRLTGIQTASYHNAVYSAASGYKQAKTSQAVQGASAVLNVLGAAGNAIAQKDIGGVLSAITSGIGGAAQNAINVENAEYNLNHVQIPFKTIGANTTFTSMGNEQYCRLIIKRPVMLDKYRAADYGASVGFACCETGILSNYSGLTVCAGADLSGIPCTAAERAEILQFLKGGVRL